MSGVNNPGHPGSGQNGGEGGATPFGAGGTPSMTDGNNATGAGAGGGGAGDTISAIGGNGANGYVKIYWGPNNDPNWVT